MSQLLAVFDAIKTSLEAMVTAAPDGDPLKGVTITQHGGDFGAEDLARYSKKAPHLIIAPLRVSVENSGGSPVSTAGWGVAVLTKDTPGSNKHRNALALVDATLRKLCVTYFGSGPLIGPSSGLVAVNEYAPELDKQGVALWAIAWKQKVELIETDPDDLDDLKTVNAKWDLYPRDNDAPLGEVVDAEDELQDLDA